jgi:hypothetical protein
MPHRKSPVMLGLLAAACANDGPLAASGQPAQGAAKKNVPANFAGVMAPPADAEAAIRAEFAHFEALGTAEGYVLFAQRHPGHPLAKEAERRANGLQAQTKD